ncbi:biotin-dependent carboxyltransferase family protein [Algibacter miyuki]|uniref:Biotin-dependent carboxyltransferase family protein n=1 Tax=Algibacter miyuki TaxID=1306933 RepID=A0ABV5H0T3_9FLAO|nr:biotin-dependent carboxyltransferase family protein [Algibacter miyuki]MDN3664104.1 biotin-dependent carboxyltransferase family protein [Algibacter miyuki]
MILVLKTGFYSSIQDFGRLGFQEFGVPYSGVMDRKAVRLANALLGNSENEAVIEMTMIGGTFQFTKSTCIAISGADMTPKLNNNRIRNYDFIAIKPGDVLSFGKAQAGFRCYLAVLGGFNAEIVMQSKSMYQNITKAVTILKNDELTYDASESTGRGHAKIRVNAAYMESEILEVYSGPEFEYLSNHQQKLLLDGSFTVSKNNNRMAYQLEEVVSNTLNSIITSPVLPGTVQLTPSGKLIILMRDCQTTGGYPRVFQLKASAINTLSQKFTGQIIQFKLLD